MVSVVERLELTCAGSEVAQITEHLSAEEDLVVDVIETFDDTITPRLSFGNEDDLNSQLQTGTQEESQASWIAIGAAEREFVVQLEETRKAESSPSSKEALHNGSIVLPADRFKRHGVAVDIDEVEAIEADTAVKIAGTDQIELMNNVPPLGAKVRVWRSAGTIRSFGREAVSSKNPVDRPWVRNGGHSETPKFPLDRHSPALGVLMGLKLPSHLAHQRIDRMRCLGRLSMRSP